MRLLAGFLLLMVATTADANDDKAALGQKAQAILKANCYRCHGQDGSSEGGFNFVLDRQRLAAGRKLVPGEAGKSAIYKRMKKDEMPPEDEKPRPTAEEIETVRQWIDAGAPDAAPASTARTEITPLTMWKLVREDLKQAGERDRRHYRYFTIAHLYNANLSQEELETYRLALSKLVNSLSWGTKVVKLHPVDPAKTIFRIDLRDYKWNDKVWLRILEAYPYGVADERYVTVRNCREMTECNLPLVRADWFVAAGSRPPLYHDVLQLPTTDKELEKLVRIDVEENIRQERVARAGFNGSGVSQHNRLIERHETPYGAYWKSYDFAGSAGRENLFERPLGPDGDNAFQHSGGEIIFSLPNGLHGYMLVDDRGNRIEKGPTSIVTDPKQADRAVVNGVSCMSCHARGMIEKADQVRESVRRNPKAFSEKETGTILALYPEKKQMERFFQDDSERYARAVAWTGGKLDKDYKIIGSDPVVNVARMFERELDMKLAAAEIGVNVEELLQVMDKEPNLGRALGTLKVEGGTVQRQTFVMAFPDLVRELNMGEMVAGGSFEGSSNTPAAPSRPVARGGRLFSNGSVVFLADMEEFDVKSGPWPFTKDGTIGNPNKQRIKLKGKASPKGLGMHPPWAPNVASVKYKLGKQAAVFKAIVGIDDSTKWGWSPATFTVFGDGKELFKSGEIGHSGHQKRFQECVVDVSKVDELELRVQVLNGSDGVHAVWFEPRLLQRADSPDPTTRAKKLFGNSSREFLSDLDEIDAKPGPWPVSKDGDKGDGKTITVNGKASLKGLGMHPPDRGQASASFKLDKQAAVFKGSVALDDNNGHVWRNATATFEVFGDGKRLWASKPIGKNKEVQDFNVNVSNVSMLELRVSTPGIGRGLHAVWIDPRLLRTKDTSDKDK